MRFTADIEKAWLRMVILGTVGVMGFATRLFSVVRFESIIHEFDPWCVPWWEWGWE